MSKLIYKLIFRKGNFMNSILKYVNDLNINKKLILLFLIISLIPTIFIGLVSFNISSRVVKERQINETIYKLSSINDKVSFLIKDKELTSIKFALDTNLHQLVSYDITDKSSYTKSLFDLQKLLYHHKYIQNTHSIYIFSSSGKMYTNDKFPNLYYHDIINADWYHHKSEKAQNYFWGEIYKISNNNVLPLIRKVKTEKGSVGMVVINLLEKSISDIYKHDLVDIGGSIIVLNNDNNIISCARKENLGKSFSDIYKVDLNFSSTNGYFQKQFNKEPYIFIYKIDKNSGWKYIGVIPISNIMSSTNYIKKATLLMCLVCIGICLLSSFFLSSRFTIPLKKLINIMDNVEEGNLNVKFIPRYNDEIGKLTMSFNNMVDRLKNSIEQIYEIQSKKRKAEYKAMEFQINPHFLYNTLSSIIWLSNRGQNQDVIKLTDSLAKLFRISISKGKEVITIKEEIEHAKNYLAIQKIRYQEEFNCIYDIDSDILGFYTIKIILQPLVENAIYHGIRDAECKGLIKIIAKRIKNDIILEVVDNGNSMSEQEIQKTNDFLANNVADEDFGIGIRNVNDRIKFYFKGDYGLEFDKDGIYTIARIKIPVVEGVDDVYNFSGR